jgi:polygalacturonase
MQFQNTVQNRSPLDYLNYLCFLVLIAALFPMVAFADPVLPTIPAGTFTLPPATGIAATDTANINATLAAAANSVNHGGTVIVPSGTYICNTFNIPSNINLQLATNAVIQNANPSNTLISVSGSNLHDIAITGSGTINGNATTTSSNNLINISNVNNLLISGVTISNSSHFHLVPKAVTNMTIDGVNINDANTSLSNTDGIDYSGSHILIKNCTVNVGDDDIVAKPQSTYCSDITITNCTIKAGHGISVGGQTNAGLDGLTVTHCTFTGTDNGLRLKAGPYKLDGAVYNNGQGLGGVVKNVSFSDITMTNVTYPIIINSWYVGGDKYGYSQISPSSSSLHNLTNPTETTHIVDQQNNSVALVPFYDNIRYTNITATGNMGSNVALIYGLDSQPANPGDPQRNIDNISFNNVNLSGSYGAAIYYASRLDVSGLHVTPLNGSTMNQSGSYTLLSGYTIWQGGNVAHGSATDWTNAYNWTSDVIPGSAGNRVAFGNQDANNNVVDMVIAPRTVGSMYFSADTSTTIQSSGGFSLTMDNNGSPSTINVSGSHTIAAPVLINNDVNIIGTGSLNLSGGISGTHAMNVQGGNLTAGSISVDTLTIASGTTVTILPIPGGPTAIDDNLQPVPEPSTLALLGIAFAGLLEFSWRRRTTRCGK